LLTANKCPFMTIIQVAANTQSMTVLLSINIQTFFKHFINNNWTQKGCAMPYRTHGATVHIAYGWE